MIDTVFFDAVGTLFEVAAPIGETYAGFVQRAGGSASPAAMERGFREAFAAAPPLVFPNATTGLRCCERDWWRRLVGDALARAGCTLPARSFEGMFEELFTYFAGARAWRLFADVFETLDDLRELGLKLAVVSNFDSRLRSLLEGLGIASRFDAVVLSSECGYAKPDWRIFAAALRAAGARAHSTLHVGDSETIDVCGARSAGLVAVHLDRRGTAGADTIISLREIVHLVG